jgi:hypothetical protein
MSLNSQIQSRFGLPTETGMSIEENKTITNILSRRSHRAFKADMVSQDLLDTLLATTPAKSACSRTDPSVCTRFTADARRYNHLNLVL